MGDQCEWRDPTATSDATESESRCILEKHDDTTAHALADRERLDTLRFCAAIQIAGALCMGFYDKGTPQIVKYAWDIALELVEEGYRRGVIPEAEASPMSGVAGLDMDAIAKALGL